MNLQFDRRDDPNLEALVGTWRRFGPSGPAYEIVGPVSADGQGRLALKVKVAETTEEIDYPVDHILGDPKET